MGFDWPASPVLFVAISVVIAGALLAHSMKLLHFAPRKIAVRLILLRLLTFVLLLSLLARPFLEQEELDESKFRLLTLTDLSGSMEVRDDRNGPKRIENS